MSKWHWLDESDAEKRFGFSLRANRRWKRLAGFCGFVDTASKFQAPGFPNASRNSVQGTSASKQQVKHMIHWTRSLSLAAALYIAIFAFAFIAAPSSCQWGFPTYFLSGLVALVALFAIPFLFESTRPRLSCFLLEFAFAVIGCGVWLAGAYVANMRILCRLF